MARINRADAWIAVFHLLILVILSVGSLPESAFAKPSAQHVAGPSQSFHDAVAAAWARLPQRRDYAAQQGAATARYNAGGTFFPNAPYADGSYFDDRAGSDYTYRTTQIGVSTPIWLPGEGTATQKTAQADGVAVAAAIEAAHLALAAQVLDLATQAAVAANARDVAARRLATTQSLAANLAHSFAAGESSQSDELAADADSANAALTLSSADAQLAAARAALVTVVGNDGIPRLDAPGPAGLQPVDPIASHPRIVAAERSVAAAQANARLVSIANRDSPEIGLQGVNDKQPGTKWDTRLGVTFRFPFATEARNAPRRAAAEQATTQAEVQLALARREILLGVQQAQAMQAGAERGSVAAERAAGVLAQRRGQIERAWRMGEMPLIELVRANALSFDADFARDRAHTDLAAARLRLRLAEGVLP
jgi:cobalt-zinc-cadmium efflux system outer membrane protein